MGSLTEKIEKYIRNQLEANTDDEIILRRKELASFLDACPVRLTTCCKAGLRLKEALSLKVNEGGTATFES